MALPHEWLENLKKRAKKEFGRVFLGFEVLKRLKVF